MNGDFSEGTTIVKCDARCSKCGKHFGWSGKPDDFPTCPKCGYRPDQETINRDAQLIQELKEFLRERPSRRQIQRVRTRVRHSTGLSLGQAAALLGVSSAVLRAVERQDADPLPWLKEKMVQLYELEPRYHR